MERNRLVYQVLLTVNEVAEILGVSRTTVYRRINEGKVEAIYIGHSVRIPRSVVSGLGALRPAAFTEAKTVC